MGFLALVKWLIILAFVEHLGKTLLVAGAIAAAWWLILKARS